MTAADFSFWDGGPDMYGTQPPKPKLTWRDVLTCVAAFAVVLAFSAALFFAQAAFAGPTCVEQNLAHFYRHGKEVPGIVVGKEDPCDKFGGAYAVSRHGIQVYVNFNIPAEVHLDVIDQALDKRTREERKFYQGINVAIVDRAFMDRRFGGAPYSLNWANNIFFISETVAADPHTLDQVLHDFYSIKG